MKKTMKKMEYAKLDRHERIRAYLEKHPEVLTDELMEYVADRILNVNNVRKAIRNQFPTVVSEIKDNFDLIPDEYL